MGILPRKFPSLSRRAILEGGVAALIVGFTVPAFAVNEPEQPSDDVKGKFAPNAFIRIDRDGIVTLVMPQVEMGQATYTSISMILAEELDAAFENVRTEHAPPNEKLYQNPMLGMQATGNSNSIRAFWMPLRQAGASARAMLVEAAAQSWSVPPGECRTESSVVIHDKSGRRASYGDLVMPASALSPPAKPVLKDPKNFKLIGRSLKRLDTPHKVNGKVVYGIDAMPENVKFATIAASPVLGGKVAHVDDTATKKIPGVRQVVVLDNIVAVVGDHMWAAKTGLDALKVSWSDGANGAVSTDEIWSRLRAAGNREGALAKQVGDVAKSPGDSDVTVAQFEVPLLAHACLEPMNCTIHVRPDGAEVWIGTQVITHVQSVVAGVTALPLEKVIVHNHLIGGGFGRRLEPDMALSAARVAQHIDGPVKIVWTREEDIRHDIFRPAYHDVLSAKLTDGRITGWKHRIAGSAVMARFAPPFFQKGVDPDGVDSAVDMPYDIPNFRVEFVREEPPGVVTGFWRGVGPNNNVFAIESFIDELAKQAGQDPVAFRRAHLGKSPRLLAVMNQVAEKSGWGKPLPPRTGRGIACQVAFGSFIATVVEAEVDKAGGVHLRQVNSVVDTGIAVNPDTIMAQLQGGLIFGLTAGLYGEITLQKGRVQQSNFHDYRMLRINEIPPISVEVVKSGEAPGGIGETGSTASLPSLRNAIFAATGIPLRRMPVDRDILSGKKKA